MGKLKPSEAVLVSCGFCNNLPQSQWLPTTETYHLTLLKVRSPDMSVWSGLCSFCRLEGMIHVLALSQLPVGAHISWLMALFSIFEAGSVVSSSVSSPCSNLCSILTSLTLSLLPPS
jgi:hypothetical protein